MRYSIVGQKHRDLDAYLPGINAGTEAFLVRDPHNQYDANAVMVWVNGQHVGFLRKRDNVHIAAYIDANGEPFDRLQPAPGLALDEAARVRGQHKAIRATFARSPNSAYPQVDIDI